MRELLAGVSFSTTLGFLHDPISLCHGFQARVDPPSRLRRVVQTPLAISLMLSWVPVATVEGRQGHPYQHKYVNNRPRLRLFEMIHNKTAKRKTDDSIAPVATKQKRRICLKRSS
jgi:hypothetical protein